MGKGTPQSPGRSKQLPKVRGVRLLPWAAMTPPPHTGPSPSQELELVEDVWRGEAQDLLSQIAQLQEENKQLMTNLSHKDASFSEEEFQKHEGKRRGQPGKLGEGCSHCDHRQEELRNAQWTRQSPCPHEACMF